MSQFPSSGVPGVGSNPLTLAYRTLFTMDTGPGDFVPGGRLLDGANTRDPGSVRSDEIRGGLLLGKITATALLASALIGISQNALSTVGTTVTLTAAQAVELVRRQGAAGTFTIIGPPAAAGTVASATVTYSAVNTTTGAVTITATGVAFIAGSFVAPTDGSQTPVTFYPGPAPIRVTDVTDASIAAVGLPLIPMTTKPVNVVNIINYPTDTSLIAWLKSKLRVAVPGMTFSDDL